MRICLNLKGGRIPQGASLAMLRLPTVIRQQS